jgi:hypothetical protein
MPLTKITGGEFDDSTNAGLSVAGIVTATSGLRVGIGITITQTSISVSGIITAASMNAASMNVGGSTLSSTIGVNTTSPKSALDLSQTTNAIALPQGTTAQRPTGVAPYIRYNTTNSALEFYNGTDWVEIISDYFPSGSTILG